MEDHIVPEPGKYSRSVTDVESFKVFLRHLAKSAELAEHAVERDPEAHKFDDPLDWQTLSISEFLYEFASQLDIVDAQSSVLSGLAEALYRSKIIE